MDYSSKENLILYCDECGCSSFRESITDRVDNYILESEIICKNCGNIVNYWGLGYYENCMSDKYLNTIRGIKLKRILDEI